MLKYARWYDVRVYKQLVQGRIQTHQVQVTCDGWFLFGLPIIRRINI